MVIFRNVRALGTRAGRFPGCLRGVVGRGLGTDQNKGGWASSVRGSARARVLTWEGSKGLWFQEGRGWRVASRGTRPRGLRGIGVFVGELLSLAGAALVSARWRTGRLGGPSAGSDSVGRRVARRQSSGRGGLLLQVVGRGRMKKAASTAQGMRDECQLRNSALIEGFEMKVAFRRGSPLCAWKVASAHQESVRARWGARNAAPGMLRRCGSTGGSGTSELGGMAPLGAEDWPERPSR